MKIEIKINWNMRCSGLPGTTRCSCRQLRRTRTGCRPCWSLAHWPALCALTSRTQAPDGCTCMCTCSMCERLFVIPLLLSLTHSHTHTHTINWSLSHSPTHSPTHSHTHTHTHTHLITHSLSLSLDLLSTVTRYILLSPDASLWCSIFWPFPLPLLTPLAMKILNRYPQLQEQ